MKNDIKKATFREVMDEFEATCAEFDAAELDIERALELHAKAADLLKELEARLARAEAKIKKD